MLLLIIVPLYGISARRSLLGKLKKQQKKQERTLKILHHDFESETLLKKSGKCSIEVKRLRFSG